MKNKLQIIAEVVARRANEGDGCESAADARQVPCYPTTYCECHEDAVAILTALNREATR